MCDLTHPSYLLNGQAAECTGSSSQLRYLAADNMAALKANLANRIII